MLSASKHENERMDALLSIATFASANEISDENHSPYEPTDYAVLERLARSGLVRPDDSLVDYGCGKGRVSFYMNHALGIRSIGIDYNPALIREAEKNLAEYTNRYSPKQSVSFFCMSAEKYRVTDETVFFFFNPFSERILSSVLSEIVNSYYENPRDIRLIFYYAFDPYLSLLSSHPNLDLIEEISTNDLYGSHNPQEKLLIYRIS